MRHVQEDPRFGPDDAGVAAVRAALSPHHRVGIAYSGGVDSATLLALAALELGPTRVVALLGVSPSLAADERTAAHEVASVIGVPVVEVRGDRVSADWASAPAIPAR